MNDEEDEENNIPAPNTQKRHAPRKWCSSGFVPKDLEFSDKASGINEKFKIGGNKPSDYFRALFDNELIRKLLKKPTIINNKMQLQMLKKTAAWYNTNVEELYIFFATAVLMGLN